MKYFRRLSIGHSKTIYVTPTLLKYAEILKELRMSNYFELEAIVWSRSVINIK